MKRIYKLAAATIGFWSVAGTASAFTVTPTQNSNSLLTTLLGDTAGLSNFNLSLSGDGRGFGTFADDPFGLQMGVVLSTGKVADLPGENRIDRGFETLPDGTKVALADLSTNLNGMCDPVTNQFCDRITLTLEFDADATVDRLFFNYVFGSEEFVEFGGNRFNDSFKLLLNGQNLAQLSDGQTVTINHLVPDSDAPALYHPDYIDSPAAPNTLTRLDGYTKVLGFEGSLQQNARNTLTIEIADIGDNFFDSAVFVQGGTLGTVAPEPIPVPEPTSTLGLLVFSGGVVPLWRRRRDRSDDLRRKLPR
ncbi:MAG TPA: choice-of-anchor L domain-containing protein [Oscillatoriales cyanobacterium M59_W2019_021]|nr:MAG: PEP-CTERM sorting domain-containing protein [Cyanobacteria bacterium J055]HIK30351.1 choice-of-anchor L domain-containing protein [Oscillatoriales cyanobacterium M4454_W2019_049]HIK49595.1 choice-of-anchor L domain-containing protein [Oscillatoriales cyanobacterium M59_W2019_021]